VAQILRNRVAEGMIERAIKDDVGKEARLLDGRISGDAKELALLGRVRQWILEKRWRVRHSDHIYSVWREPAKNRDCAPKSLPCQFRFNSPRPHIDNLGLISVGPKVLDYLIHYYGKRDHHDEHENEQRDSQRLPAVA